MNRSRWLFMLVLLVSGQVALSQPGISFDLKKPEKFENRKLGSEKTDDKKYTVTRRFVQNTVSHYNYYFNANEKLKDILLRAKTDHKDDFSELISFYNYTIDGTSRYKTDLDSVIYKTTAGILLHDLRTNWVDNFYLLMGQAYFYRKSFDSAYLTFQYLNFAFSPKEEDGYDKVIGSNSNEGSDAFSISTNEKRNVVKKVLSRPPSRNEALLWQIKNWIANDELAEAAGLIQTLKYDPLFPKRLHADLEEMQAWYFYKQQLFDSAAAHLENAMSNAANQQEKARWEYLIAQLYERSGKQDLSLKYYERSIKHTIDPVMEVYALLNSIRRNNDGTSNEIAIQQAIDALNKMGRRDKYLMYRDIIYYTAAKMEIDRKNPEAAKLLLQKSIRSSAGDMLQKSKSFLALADVSYQQKDFANAKKYYDSVDMATVAPEDLAAFGNRKEALGMIFTQQNIILRQDSLQKIAAMPEAEREVLLKKMLRRLRREQGLKEEDPAVYNPGFVNTNAPPVDLFNASAAKGEWYFINAAAKSKGFGDFRSKWGTRPNTDNWRRFNSVQRQGPAGKENMQEYVLAEDAAAKPLSLESLMDKLPLTPEKLKTSDDSIMNAQFVLAKTLQDGLEDYSAAITAYEAFLQRFPGAPQEEEALFNLYYCYKKAGETSKMAQVKSMLESKFGNGKFSNIVKNPGAVDSLSKRAGSALYEEIYTLFIEGRFAEATARKKSADSIYGKHYWSPQLLYIESVYHIQERNDSVAKIALGNIISLYPGQPMAVKAQRLLEVLGRRAEIENYLTNLQIERPAGDSSMVIVDAPNKRPPTAQKQPVVVPSRSDSTGVRMPDNPVVKKTDTATVPRPADTSAIRKPMEPVVKKPADPVKPRTDTVAAPARKPVVVQPSLIYTNAPDQPHMVVLVMDKVDPVYVTEARNAFNRYNREKFSSMQIDLAPFSLTDDTRFLLFSQFENAAAALEYVGKTKKLAGTEVIPWMPAGKYSFLIVTEQNLEILKNRKDIPAYLKFLTQSFPGQW